MWGQDKGFQAGAIVARRRVRGLRDFPVSTHQSGSAHSTGFAPSTSVSTAGAMLTR